MHDVVELYEYSPLEILVHLAITVESQFLKKTHFKTTYNDGFYKTSWKDKNKTYLETFPSNFVKDTTYKPIVSNPSSSTPKSPNKTSNQKCFKFLGFGHIVANFPSKRNMMVKGGLS